MPKTQMSCPRCRQPIVAEIEQLFDVGIDPQSKQRFLSGKFNVAKCRACGYEGPLSTPLVYHDPEKELLLTYFPPEMGLPLNEQERIIGPLITQAVNKLPAEKRKAYLFRPQTMFTLQTMIEKVLEGDGITKEMLDASQKRLNLLQRLMTTSKESRAFVVQQEEALMDEAFFEMLTRLIQASLMGGDRQSAQQLAALQQEIMPLTKVGQKLAEQSKEAEAAMKQLQEANQNGTLTRESLLEMMIVSPSETHLGTLVGMARSGLDYTFFQNLTAKIDAAEGDEKGKLEALREKLLKMTQEIDKRIQQEMEEMRKVLDEVLNSPNIEEATMQILPQIDNAFASVLEDEMQKARKNSDLERINKLQKVIGVLQQASTPPEFELIQQILNNDPAEWQSIMESNPDMITPEFLNILNNLISGEEMNQQPPEVKTMLEELYRVALRFSMQKNIS